MIELRWVRVRKTYKGSFTTHPYEYNGKELQYRYQHPSLGFDGWSPWQTVPEVEAFEPAMVTADRPRSST